MIDDQVVFVTGGTGFVGRHAVHALLRRGYEVHIASRRWTGPFAPSPRLRIHHCDLFDTDYVGRVLDMIRPTHLLHLAWDTAHGEFWQSPRNLRWVEASLGLLRGFAEAGGRRAVFAGSCAEYDWTAGPCDEAHTPLKPASLYGVCKHAVHQVAADYAQVTGINLAWARLFHLFGPGEDDRRFVPSLVRPMLIGERAVCRHGGLRRDFLHVRDAGDALGAITDGDVAGAINVASGRTAALGDVAAALAAIVGGNAEVRVESGRATADDPAELAAVTTRLASEVHWAPSVTLTEGLRSVVHTLRQRRHSRAA